MIEDFAALIPDRLRDRSGAVFYSGRRAFAGPAALYVLGLNPGGSPDGRETETVRWHTEKVLRRAPDDWSAYRDESWRGGPPGTSGMQPRVLHLLRGLGLDPGAVPTSNVVFSRSSREATMDGRFADLADECWPFHRAVVDRLKPSAVLCFGQTAGTYVRGQLGATEVVARFVEDNGRGWTSRTYRGPAGPDVVVAAHPSRADWTNPRTDPTGLVLDAIRSRP